MSFLWGWCACKNTGCNLCKLKSKNNLHTYTQSHACMHTHSAYHTHTHMHMHTHTYTHTHTLSLIHTNTYMSTQAHRHACTHTHTHTHKHTHTHVHTHTHTHYQCSVQWIFQEGLKSTLVQLSLQILLFHWCNLLQPLSLAERSNSNQSHYHPEVLFLLDDHLVCSGHFLHVRITGEDLMNHSPPEHFF